MNTQKLFEINGKTFSLEQIAAFNPDDQHMLTQLSIMPIGESWDDGNGSETVTRIADAVDAPNVLVTTEQLHLIIRALGVAERQLSRLHRDAIENTINVHGARDIADQLRQVNHFHEDACSMVDLIAYLKTVIK